MSLQSVVLIHILAFYMCNGVESSADSPFQKYHFALKRLRYCYGIAFVGLCSGNRRANSLRANFRYSLVHLFSSFSLFVCFFLSEFMPPNLRLYVLHANRPNLIAIPKIVALCHVHALLKFCDSITFLYSKCNILKLARYKIFKYL